MAGWREPLGRHTPAVQKVKEFYEENRKLIKGNKSLLEGIAALKKNSAVPGNVGSCKLREKQ